MNFGELKTSLVATLNRRDVTSTQLGNWIKMSVQRAQRLLSTPASIKTAIYTVGSGFESLPIPGDLLRLVSLEVNGIECKRSDTTGVRALAKRVGQPRLFCQADGTFVLGPRPGQGDEIRLEYSANFADLTADTDTNALLAIAPDVVVAGAMVLACQYFVDPRGDSYEMSFVNGIVDLNNQAAADALTNAVFSPAYSFDFGDD